MTYVLLHVMPLISFFVVLCQATNTASGINIIEEVEDTFNVMLTIGTENGQILKSTVVPNCSVVVRIKTSHPTRNHETRASGDCRLPIMQVSLGRLIPLIASALVITLLTAAISASASTRWAGENDQKDDSIGGNGAMPSSKDWLQPHRFRSQTPFYAQNPSKMKDRYRSGSQLDIFLRYASADPQKSSLKILRQV